MEFSRIIEEQDIIVERTVAEIRNDWDGLRSIYTRYKDRGNDFLIKRISQWIGSAEGLNSIEEVNSLLDSIKADKARKGSNFDDLDVKLGNLLRTRVQQMQAQKEQKDKRDAELQNREKEVRGNIPVNQAYY